MSDKKLLAKAAMLKQLSKKSKDSMYEGFGKGLKEKKGLDKVTVMAPDKEGLEKGLSMAQKLMKAKFGKIEEEDESEEAESEGCEYCEDEDCPGCEESDEE
jgi:hypothetical protein